MGNTSKGIADDVVDYFLTGSADRIDSALRQHYVLPLTNPPHTIKRAEVILTSYDLLCHIGQPPEKDGNITKEYDHISDRGGLLDRYRDGSEALQDASKIIDSSQGAYVPGPRVGTFLGEGRRYYTDSSGKKITIV